MLIYSKLKEIAIFPWSAIGDTQVSLLTICGLIIILLVVWRAGIALEQTVVRIGRGLDKESSQGWNVLSRISRYAIWIAAIASIWLTAGMVTLYLNAVRRR